MKGPILCRRSNDRVPFAPSVIVFALLFIASMPISSMKSFAAAAGFQWVNDIVPGLGDYYNYRWTNTTPLAVDRMGNSYLLSLLFGGITNGTDVLTSRGGSDVLLLKYDRNGTLSWAKRLGGDQNETGIAITVDRAGNSYLTGTSRGSTNADFGRITVTNADTNFLFVAKFDSSGNTIWVNKAGGPNLGPLPDGIASDSVGNCYVTGSLGQQVTNFGSVTITNAKATTPFLAKYDSTGSFVWVKVALSSSFSGFPLLGDKVVCDDGGHVYWLGEYSGTVSLDGTVLAGKTQADLFWAQLNESGDVTSLKRIGARSFSHTTSVALDTQGHAYFVSSFSSANLDFGGLSLTNHGWYDAFVAKCDLEGRALWVRGLGGKLADYGAGVAVDDEGNCYAAGSFSSSDLDLGGAILASRGGYDAFVAKFDVLGNLVWVKQAGGTQYDIAFGIGLDAAANCYVTGVRQGSASFDSIQMADVGFNTTFFLAKIVEPPALNLAFAGQQAFLYWPAAKSDFSLESSTDLSTNANWSPVTSPFVILGDQRVVIDDLKAGNRFYRLKE